MDFCTFVRCSIGIIILMGGTAIREDHYVWAVILMIIGYLKFAANIVSVIEKESSK